MLLNLCTGPLSELALCKRFQNYRKGRNCGGRLPTSTQEKVGLRQIRIDMKTRINLVRMAALALTLIGATYTIAQQAGAGRNVAAPRPKGPCDIYAAAGDACVAAHSTTRALYASYNGPLYQVLRQSDGKTMDVGVVQATATLVPDPGGYADAAAQDKFCTGTYCWISIIYDQSP